MNETNLEPAINAQSHKCTLCHKAYLIEEGVKSYRPFCSKRCADVDMGRWLSGSYVISEGGALEVTEGEDEAPLLDEQFLREE